MVKNCEPLLEVIFIRLHPRFLSVLLDNVLCQVMSCSTESMTCTMKISYAMAGYDSGEVPSCYRLDVALHCSKKEYVTHSVLGEAGYTLFIHTEH